MPVDVDVSPEINVIGSKGPYADAPLSGSLEHKPGDNNLDGLLNSLLEGQTESDSICERFDPMESTVHTNSTEEPISMQACMVKLDILSDDIIKKWTVNKTNTDGKSVYNLHDRHLQEGFKSN